MTNFEILLFCSRGNFSIKLQRHGCSSKDLLHNFITPFTKSTSGEVFQLMWVKLLLALIWPLWCCSIAPWCCSGTVVPWCSGYDYCTTSFNKPWTQVLCRFKPCLRHVGGLLWWDLWQWPWLEIRLSTFRQSTIPQKQFIIIIIITLEDERS